MTERWIQNQPAWRNMKIILFDKRARQVRFYGKMPPLEMSGQKSFGLEKAGNSFCSRLEQSSLDNLKK